MTFVGKSRWCRDKRTIFAGDLVINARFLFDIRVLSFNKYAKRVEYVAVVRLVYPSLRVIAYCSYNRCEKVKTSETNKSQNERNPP